jgi:hypothetical protein
MMWQIRERGELVHRLRDEALALTKKENIPVADAIEFMTDDVELRREIWLVLT